MSSPKVSTSSATSNTAVRVRFAPSPTGQLHIGGIRSSLFNWLWARHTGGTFVLRLEDTDRTRFIEGSEEQILDSHDQLGITPDESPRVGGPYGPYRQSERKTAGIYDQHARTLLESGALYRCWCSAERLATLREEAQAKGVAFKYDRHCLRPENHSDPQASHVLRFRIPDAPATISWNDAVRGPHEVRTDTLDDFVAIKADGYPTYHFAHVVDDYLMKISHVMRADEWIPSTPKHLLLFAAFGWKAPVYAHLPAVQGPSGTKKLSKRDGAQSVSEYIAEGYLPEALRSFLATLGWNDGTTDEIYTTAQLIDRFTLDRIQKSPAKFDKDRLTWVNGMMIRALWQKAPQELLKHCERFWPAPAQGAPDQQLLAILELVQDRLKHLDELPELTDFFFSDPNPTIAEITFNGRIKSESAQKALDATIGHLQSATSFAASDLEALFKEKLFPNVIGPLDHNSFNKRGPYFMMLRVALTGKTATPGLFETMSVLGRDTVIRRLSKLASQN